MLGAALALLAAFTFALNNAAFRRGALSGSVAQAMAISLAVGVLMFVAVLPLARLAGPLPDFPASTVAMLAVAGIVHFAWGRYFNFKATKAMGANLVGPVQQLSLLVTLVLAIALLGEVLTPLRIAGIGLLLAAPLLAFRAPAPAPRAAPATFTPDYLRGYAFAILSTLGYGTSPILVRASLQDAGLAASLYGGLIAYAAAAVAMGLALVSPAVRREVVGVQPVAARWFAGSGVLVCLSQMFGYMALALAPVTVVVPIQRLSLILRVYVNGILNREHEVIGGRIWIGTVVALLGALAVSVDARVLLRHLPVPDTWQALLDWSWAFPSVIRM